MTGSRPDESIRSEGPAQDVAAWRLATESIVVRIRWFGVVMGYALVELRDGLLDPMAVRLLLAVGAIYALLDTISYRRGQVFLGHRSLFVSVMEALFIGLLCHYDLGVASPFVWYFALSLICAAIRYRPAIAWRTFACDCLSLSAVAWASGSWREQVDTSVLTAVILAWVTWAASSLASLLKATGERLRQVNGALERQSAELEQRVAERTEALRSSQARVLHQEKMAAFGLLAAGIAHEVGNPLAAISSLVQMLQRRGPDAYTAEKLELAGSQLTRIQRTIRELVDFSRPASMSRGRVQLGEVVDEALGIAKYYHRTKHRDIQTAIARELPPVVGVRDHLTQVVLNLILNAIDATDAEGQIRLNGEPDGAGWVLLTVADDGRGVAPQERDRLFQPYFTTKPRGTGLGLYVSRQIVEEHGGRIELAAPGVEGGAVFRIRLPAAGFEALPAPRRDASSALEGVGR